ncbi:MAG: tetratricopeptide repeat protein [Candidatus Electryonea clarkiae]|nr:tetratricopeptide repeat protein [Candidatus Electryonea clarkiae]MDP8286688.1 tetratricopeptide repeat protein [Candidatus Electryonea clarkiae]
MSIKTYNKDKLRILLAIARPLANRLNNEHAAALDVLRPGEEETHVREGLKDLDKSVELHILPHATKKEISRRLESNPGYDVLHISCHGSGNGTIYLEDENCPGWAKSLDKQGLAEMVGNKVPILILSACYGEKTLHTLFNENDGNRPQVIIHGDGEYPMLARAVQLFIEGFFRNLTQGANSSDAFKYGKKQVKEDGVIGADIVSDGVLEDKGPSPYKRLRLNSNQPIKYTNFEDGQLSIKRFEDEQPLHRKTDRTVEEIIGRNVQIARMMDELRPPLSGINEPRYRLVNLHGEGGIGKTRLAQAICDSLAEYRLFPGGICEVDCDRIWDTKNLALAIFKALGKREDELTAFPVDELPEFLDTKSRDNGKIILMLDNLDDLFSADGENLDPHPAKLIRKIFSQCDKIKILSTCRSKLNISGYGIDYQVDPLDVDLSMALFLHFLPEQDVFHQVEGLQEKTIHLLKAYLNSLGGHPLSLFITAHRMSFDHDPIEKQLEKAQDEFTGLLSAPEIQGLSGREKILQACLDQSYNRLTEPAKETFKQSSFFPGGMFRNFNTLNPLLGEKWRDSMKEATDIGLCRFDAERQQYWMLNPVREYAAQKMTEEEKNKFYLYASKQWAKFTEISDFYLNPVQNSEWMEQLKLPENSEEQRKILAEMHDWAFAALQYEEPNILHAFLWVIEIDFTSGELIADNFMAYLELAGKLQASVFVAEKMLDKCIDQDIKAGWAINLGYRLSMLGDFAGAIDKTEEALEILRELEKKQPETYKPNIATALNNLGEQLEKTGNHKSAITKTEEALQIRRELAKKNPDYYIPYVAMTLNNLGNKLSYLGDFDGAMKQTKEALEKYRELVENHSDAYIPNVAMTLNNLGHRLSILDEFREAKTKTEEALKIYRELAKKHPEAYMSYVAITLNNIGNILSKLDDFRRAKEKTEEALQIFEKLAVEHPNAYMHYIAKTLNNLGQHLKNLGEFAKAKKKTEGALNIGMTFSVKYPDAYLKDVRQSLENLRVILENLDLTKEAVEWFEKFITLSAIITNNTNNTAYYIQACLYSVPILTDIGETAKAEEYLNNAKKILEPFVENSEAAKSHLEEVDNLLSEIINKQL